MNTDTKKKNKTLTQTASTGNADSAGRATKQPATAEYSSTTASASGGNYNSKYEKYIDKLTSEYMNREDYSYDADNDKTFQQYKNRYTQLGQQAMKDTVGNAALLTGGYGNSYGVTAGQQAYNSYMDNIADKAADFENQAYQRWLQEGDSYLDKIGVLQQADSIDYERFRDDVADSQWREQFDYSKEQDSLAQENWQKSFDRQNYESDRAYDRDVYESDRAYDRDVYESDRAYDRDVYESDRAYDRDVYEYNTALQQAAAEAAAEIDDDEYFNPNDAYEFFKEYGDYAHDDAEIAEVFVQLFGAQDGFKSWAEQITLPGGGNLLEEIYGLYPQLAEQTAVTSEILEYANTLAGNNKTKSNSSNGIQDIINYRETLMKPKNSK